MAEQDTEPGGIRFLASGDESGTAPGDRLFRPDVEGLRAVAIILVVLFHSGVSALSGGYVGVDVFFVISGFVITGVLLRERAVSVRTSLLAFYGRRCRRIIPAATVVIIVTVVLAYLFLGVGVGGRTAIDGRWATVFLANVHFNAIGVDYLSARLSPSPLQNFWSLSVEEQFYVVYPTLFLLLAGIRSRWSLRVRLAVGLTVVTRASLAFSVVDTHSDAVGAYFSPFSRAWELGLGALVAVGTPWLKRLPVGVAAAATWIGLGAILAAACTFGAQTAYPGSAVAIPVFGAAFIIAGGVVAPRLGVEVLLRLPPLRAIGKLSYSLYLWHWPILVIAADYAGKTTLSVGQNLAWDAVALGASVLSYLLVENPIRHARVLLRVRWASVGMGVALVVLALGAIGVQTTIAAASGSPSTTPATAPTPSPRDTLRLVAASDRIRIAPSSLVPPLSEATTASSSDIGFPPSSTGCRPDASQSKVPRCAFADLASARTMVLYGDSHAGMWFRSIEDIAKRAHWRLMVLYKPACPAEPLPVRAIGTTGRWVACADWQRFAIKRINQIDPVLLIVSQASDYEDPTGRRYTPMQWQGGLTVLFAHIAAPHAVKIVLGNLPSSKGPDCVAQHVDDVQLCATPPRSSLTPYNNAERLVADAEGARYIDVTPWFCGSTCSAVIGDYDVYAAGGHVTLDYSRFLESVLGQSLDLAGLAKQGRQH